jgi:hypothetical protein
MTLLYHALADEQTIYLLCEIMQTLCLCCLVWRHQ